MTYQDATRIARAAGLDPHKWGLAFMDDGIVHVARTGKECFKEAGICTKFKRTRIGRYGSIYLYQSEAGTMAAYVGPLVWLLMEQFQLNLPKKEA